MFCIETIDQTPSQLKLPATILGHGKAARDRATLRAVIRLMCNGRHTHPQRDKDRVSLEIQRTGSLLASGVVRFMQSPSGLANAVATTRGQDLKKIIMNAKRGYGTYRQTALTKAELASRISGAITQLEKGAPYPSLRACEDNLCRLMSVRKPWGHAGRECTVLPRFACREVARDVAVLRPGWITGAGDCGEVGRGSTAGLAYENRRRCAAGEVPATLDSLAGRATTS